MILGAHVILYTTDADRDRAFFRDVLEFPNVDVGGGWLIFALPQGEVAFHPHSKNDEHEFFLMCDDVKAFLAKMKKHKVKCEKVVEQPYGAMTAITLPGGGKLGVYQPYHALASTAVAKKPAKKRAK